MKTFLSTFAVLAATTLFSASAFADLGTSGVREVRGSTFDSSVYSEYGYYDLGYGGVGSGDWGYPDSYGGYSNRSPTFTYGYVTRPYYLWNTSGHDHFAQNQLLRHGNHFLMVPGQFDYRGTTYYPVW